MPPTAAAGSRKGGHGASGGRSGQQRKAGKGEQPASAGQARVLQDPDEEDTNAGFGKYLRSQEGIEMMKLFVIANTIVVFLTMAWPQMQQSYQLLRSLIFATDDDDDDADEDL